MKQYKFEDIYNFSKKLNILYIDDDTDTRDETYEILERFFNSVDVAKDGEDGIQKCIHYKNTHGEFYDLIITDIIMPKKNGIELIEEILDINEYQNIIVLSAYDESSKLVKLIELGVDGFIVKPIKQEQLLKTFYKVLHRKKTRTDLESHFIFQKQQLIDINNDLEQQMIERISQVYALNEEIKQTQREVVFTMGAIGESRSKETGNHVRRVALYSAVLAKHYGLKEDAITLLKEASPMHDIGKVAIADSILNKAGVLTKEERNIMMTHTTLGYDMLKHSTRELLKTAAIIAKEHHEKYDGTGYPLGLKGEEININARITALADVFDALGSNRCYKMAWDDEKIFEMFVEEKGKHFDPILVDIFFKNLDEFFSIREKYQDIF
jgi:response regulator RpfG family c-di-GMP phosphodiesterase